MTHPLVPRPRRLAGITSLREHYKRSEVRTDRILADMPDSVPIPWLYHGDAVYHASSSARGHPLQPSAPMFTAVLALDCAYHFRTRQVFLKQALDMLKPGGRIGLADICFDFAPNGWRARLVSVLGVMPYENVVRPSDYVRMMQDMGYVDVELEDISDRVFAGFFAFLRSQGGLWPLFVGAMNMLVRWGMKFVIVSAGKPLPNS
jgi:SAM-dependent methyltransferase